MAFALSTVGSPRLCVRRCKSCHIELDKKSDENKSIHWNIKVIESRMNLYHTTTAKCPTKRNLHWNIIPLYLDQRST